jgi:two-component system sensor histidine kinase DesK
VLAVGFASIALVFVLQVLNSSPDAARWRWRRRAAMLFAQAAVTYLPLLVLGREWGGMAGFLAGSVLLLIPGWPAWVLFTGIASSMLITPLLLGLSAQFTAYLMISTIDIGLVVFGLSRLSLVIDYLKATRGDLAQLAVIRERMRFARDLHDLLGYSLSAITLKAELTRRLVTSNPGRARDEVAEVLDIARQALADVRQVASGYRNMSLAKEVSAVASLLSAAGIAVQVEVTCGALEEKVDTVLATVLREAVTNTLRHSTARNCSIEAGQAGQTIRLQVINDGVSHPAAAGRQGGGLGNLTARLQEIGGRLTAGVRPDGRFGLLAEAPLRTLDDVAAPLPGVVAGMHQEDQKEELPCLIHVARTPAAKLSTGRRSRFTGQ